MITDAELLKLVMDRFPEADTDGIVEQFSLLKVGLLQANAKLAVGDAGQQGVEEQSISAADGDPAPKKRYTRRSLVVKPEEAIGDDTVQCCICGKAFQNLNAKHIQNHELTVEEYEALRLMDYLGLNQKEAAAQMGVARTTVQRIYAQDRN